MYKLNLGCGKDIREGWINVDRVQAPGVGLVTDLTLPNCLSALADNSVEEIVMLHLLEHIADPLQLMQELWRVAAPGCILRIAVPHGANDMAFADPQHIRQYFPISFHFFAQPAYKRADYGYRGDWETEEILLQVPYDFPPPDMTQAEIGTMLNGARNLVSEMRAQLRAIKPARDPSVQHNFDPRVGLIRSPA